jgi:hypothetical protein
MNFRKRPIAVSSDLTAGTMAGCPRIRVPRWFHTIRAGAAVHFNDGAAIIRAIRPGPPEFLLAAPNFDMLLVSGKKLRQEPAATAAVEIINPINRR